MTVWVDELKERGWRMYGRQIRSSHMMADTQDELHVMAEAVGMKRSWFQDRPRLWHYDLTESRRAAAIRLGAIELSDRESLRRSVPEFPVAPG